MKGSVLEAEPVLASINRYSAMFDRNINDDRNCACGHNVNDHMVYDCCIKNCPCSYWIPMGLKYKRLY